MAKYDLSDIIKAPESKHSLALFNPNRKDGLEQLKSYCNAEGSPVGVWTNGSEIVILNRQEPNVFINISEIPTVDQTLQDVITELWTIDNLTQEQLCIESFSARKKAKQLLEEAKQKVENLIEKRT